MAGICEELRQMDADGIKEKVDSLRKELYELVYQAKAGRVEKPHRIKIIRRDIARCRTVMRERAK